MKPTINHGRYLMALRALTPEQRLRKAFELSVFSRDLLRIGLKRRHPDLDDEELAQRYQACMAKARARSA